ncbi:MAG: DUF3179 domain-containing protein [Hyphomicrobiaceae bacterium]
MRSITLAAVVLAIGGAAIIATARAEPAAWKREGWSKTDFSRASINWREIRSGGPPKDGIPSIDRPRFMAVGEIRDLADVEAVVSLEIAGDARAYPVRILIWHEIVNDIVAGRPVAITYCPLCNSALVFDRTLDAEVLDFGTTGKLRNSDLVMYDRQTESWWQQFTGEAIVGAMLGRELAMIPARLEAYADFKARHPDGRVLVPNDPLSRSYGQNPYVGYDTAARPFLYDGALPDGIEPMARVVVVRPGSGVAPIIVTLEHLRSRDQLDVGPGLKVWWRPGQASALDTSDIARGRDVGTVEAVRVAADGTSELVVTDVTFAFAAHAFHPDIEIIGIERPRIEGTGR